MSFNTVLSPTGRFVLFSSTARLVRRDTNAKQDLYRVDRATGAIRLISVSSKEAVANGSSVPGSVSADGRLVTFSSEASNLVPHDTNRTSDSFARNLVTGQTRRLNVSTNGGQSSRFTGYSVGGLMSRTGRYVAFDSKAQNLVRADDTNQNRFDVYVRDRRKHTTRRVSLTPDGDQPELGASLGGMSADGRYVAFSAVDPLVRGVSIRSEVYVRDRFKHTTRRVSVSMGGGQANGDSSGASMSPDGRYVVFKSAASDLVIGDTNGSADVFVRDRVKHKTWRVSLSSTGAEGNENSFLSGRPAISADGRFVVFSSEASNLVADDTNGFADVFVRDRWTHQTQRVNVSSSGAQADRTDVDFGQGGSISRDGRFVGFQSTATNLIPDDTNNAIDVFVRGPLS